MTFEKPAFIALCYFLFTFGYIISTGFYHIGELAIIIVTSAILVVFYARPQVLNRTNIPNDHKVLAFILTIILTINIAVMGARLGDAAQTNWQFYSAANRMLAATGLLIALSFFLKNPPKGLTTFRLPALILIALAVRIFSIISAPNPTIDVFYILRDGPKLLLEARNPYELSYPAPYGVYIPTIIFVYGPLVPVLFLPASALLNDPRYLLVVADLITALLIYKLAQKLHVAKNFSHLIILIFLFHPLFPFMTEQSWLEPTVTMLFTASTFFFTTNPKSTFGPLFLGAILAVKSVYILPMLAYLKNIGARPAQYLIAILVPIVVSAPFLIANPQLFLDRTQTYVTDPSAISRNLAPTEISLNIAAVILKYTNFVLPTALVGLLGAMTTLAVIIKKPKSSPFVILSVFLVFMTLFMFGPFVFLHYFAFMGNVLLITLILFLGKSRQAES